MPSNLMLAEYKIFAIVGYTLFGIGLAFYATPSTDAALSSLPDAQVGSGAGIYKMASSLGAAFGVAIFRGYLHRAQRQSGGCQLARRRYHLPRASRQSGDPPSGYDRARL